MATRKRNQKFYLLTFNEKIGDKHNIPALTCLDAEGYDEWKQSYIGPVNGAWERDKGYVYTLKRCRIVAQIAGDDEPFTQFEGKGYLRMEDLVKAEIVKVTEVTKDFYATFNKTGLPGLSLCNIFNETDLDYDADYDDYEDDYNDEWEDDNDGNGWDDDDEKELDEANLDAEAEANAS